ncbi:MAG: phosphonate ABC transporter, permease protein PhnE [Burkholderiaceae bacterium]
MSRPATEWALPHPMGVRSLLVLMAVVVAGLFAGQRVEIGRMLALSGEGVLAALGLREQSQVLSGLETIGRSLFPPQFSERTETARIEGFDHRDLPWFSYLETVEVHEPRLDPQTLKMEETVERREFLVQPLGYVWHVAVKMLETFEIAIWATLLAIVLSAPLAWCSAKNYTPHPLVYTLARSVVGLLRAVPELVSALFLVLAYGFGPIAGVLALALHSAGFLGKFYAEDIETADDKPQEALRAIGASQLKVMRYAVLPQVMPQFIAYTLYVLDRNVRMATVVGLVGAGGIGQELKGRYDMYNYAHVGTILIAIFLTVLALDRVAARLRGRYA